MKELVNDLRDVMVIAKRPGVQGLQALDKATLIVGCMERTIDNYEDMLQLMEQRAAVREGARHAVQLRHLSEMVEELSTKLAQAQLGEVIGAAAAVRTSESMAYQSNPELWAGTKKEYDAIIELKRTEKESQNELQN